MGTPIDITQIQALRHFGILESNFTPLLDVFLIPESTASMPIVRKMYRRLAVMVHPDRCKIDKRGSEKAIRTLARAIALAESEAVYA